MICLLDTHLLIWLVSQHAKCSNAFLRLLADENNSFLFSTASLWEVAIKQALNRPGFGMTAQRLRQELHQRGIRSLTITDEHAMHIAKLPLIHHDPFDRMLIAQANVEEYTLVTSDVLLAQYPGVIRLV